MLHNANERPSEGLVSTIYYERKSRASEEERKRMEKRIVMVKRAFSTPRFARYTLPSPPKREETPAPLLCISTVTIRSAADTA